MRVELDKLIIFVLVLARMTGVVVFNPIFNRARIPNLFKAGFTLALAFVIFGGVSAPNNLNPNTLEFIFMILKELVIGYITGTILNITLAVFAISGDIIDMQMGLSMSRIMDPGSQSQLSVTSTMMTYMFILIFFYTNSHLTLISIMADSFNLIPAGVPHVNSEFALNIVNIYGKMITLAVKMALPVMMVELFTEMALGLLMKVVPSIHLLVINLQIKITLGIFCILIIMPSIMRFMENVLEIFFENLQRNLSYFIM